MRAAVVVATLVAHASATATWYPGHQTWHLTGYRYDDTAWAASVHNTSEAYLTYGPYTHVPAADYTVSFVLSIDNNSADDVAVVAVDVHDATSNAILANATVRRAAFAAAFVPQAFNLSFTATSTQTLEFRVYYHCCSFVVHHSTVLSAPLSGGAMGAGLWSNQSHPQFVAKHRFPTTPSNPASAGMNVGFQFVTRPDAWYLFHREYGFTAQPSYCKADYARLVVLRSTDKGVTWTNKTIMATPTPNTAYECALVDGGAFYDEDKDQWLYLSQCLARDDVWNMCLFTRDGADPLGPFTPAAGNPVVKSGQLWESICAGTGKHCTPGMGSEGTPEIVQKVDGFYFVTFHGWDPKAVASARGVAKTADWATWVTDDGGLTLPGDAIFSFVDCDPWTVPGGWSNGRCVGGGEGTMLRSGDYFYHLIEAPDISLGCLTTPGQQNWVLGLLRSPTLVWRSGQWQQFQVEATVIPAVKQGCYIQYHRLFADVADGALYLEYWADDWMQLFRLQAGGGPLPIVAGPPPST